MSKKTTFQCDKCKHFVNPYEPASFFWGVKITAETETGPMMREFNLDFCKACWGDFLKTLGSGE